MHDFEFDRRYSMAHRLIEGVGGKCAMIHGHNEFVKVTCQAMSVFEAGANMSMTFGDAKGVWHEWIDTAVDHSLQLSDTDPLVSWFADNEPHRCKQLMVTPGDPTTEMLLMVMARKFQALCGGALQLDMISIQETPTNTVRLRFPTTPRSLGNGRFLNMAPHQFMTAAPDPGNWWDRPDMSINNFSL